MYAIRSYYDREGNRRLGVNYSLDLLRRVINNQNVITSYSIHYTKLYDINRKPNFTAIGLTLLLSYLGYALFAHLSDTTASFYTALSLSLLIAGFVCMIFWLLYDRFSFKGLQSMIIALIFCSGYPLAVFYKDYSGVVLNATYIALVFYLMILYVIYRKGVDTPQDDNEEL